MRTIGKHLSSNRPRGDFPEECHYCGIPWMRSQLKTDGDGKLYCPDEGSDHRGVGEAQRENIQIQRDAVARYAR